MTEEFNLSEEEHYVDSPNLTEAHYYESDVKEFIRRLKDYVYVCFKRSRYPLQDFPNLFNNFIDKLAGDNLTGEEDEK